jgi:FSR family fosmidomycin resistance protein-like MFS transporter
MGIHQIGFGLGAILGPTLAIAIALHWGWRVSFFLYLIPGLVVAGLIWLLAPEVVKKKSAVTYWADVRSVLSWRLVPFMLTQAVALFVLWMYYTWVPSYAVKTLHIGLFHSGLFGTIVPGMAIISQPIGGWVSDKIGRRNALLISFGVSLAMIIVLPFARAPWELVTVLVCVGMANWFTPVTFSYIGDLYRDARGTACSVVEFAGFFFGGAPAPFIIGAIAQHFGFRTAFTIGTILLVIGFTVTYTLLRRSVVESPANRLTPATA